MKEIIQQLQSLGSRSLEEDVRLCGRLEAEPNRRKRFHRISLAVHLLSFFLAVELLIADCYIYLSDDLANEDFWAFLADIYGMFPLNKTSLIVLTGVLAGIFLFLPMVLDRVFTNVCENLPERKPSSRMNDALRTSGVNGKLQYIKTTLDCFVKCDFSDFVGWCWVFGYAVEITGIPLCRRLVKLLNDSNFIFNPELIWLAYIPFGGMLFGFGFCVIMENTCFLWDRLITDQRKIVDILKTYDVYAEKVRLDAMSPEERRQFMEEKTRRKREEEERKERAEEAKVMLWALNNKASFDADSYVSKNCTSYIYGIASEDDIKKIENDSSLTSSQKEAAKSELKHKSDMYY